MHVGVDVRVEFQLDRHGFLDNSTFAVVCKIILAPRALAKQAHSVTSDLVPGLRGPTVPNGTENRTLDPRWNQLLQQPQVAPAPMCLPCRCPLSYVTWDPAMFFNVLQIPSCKLEPVAVDWVPAIRRNKTLIDVFLKV